MTGTVDVLRAIAEGRGPNRSGSSRSVTPDGVKASSRKR